MKVLWLNEKLRWWGVGRAQAGHSETGSYDTMPYPGQGQAIVLALCLLQAKVWVSERLLMSLALTPHCCFCLVIEGDPGLEESKDRLLLKAQEITVWCPDPRRLVWMSDFCVERVREGEGRATRDRRVGNNILLFAHPPLCHLTQASVTFPTAS